MGEKIDLLLIYFYFKLFNKIMIIGLLVNKNVGKDTIADYLVKNKNFKKYAFADPLKEALIELFGLEKDQLYGNKKEEIDEYWGITPREIMQFFGTDVMQYKMQELLPNIERKFFVKRFEQILKKYPNQNIVVSDVRFQHEIDSIKENGGIIIKINRENSSKTYLDHISESGIDNLKGVDHLIDNNSTPNNAFNKVQKLLLI